MKTIKKHLVKMGVAICLLGLPISSANSAINSVVGEYRFDDCGSSNNWKKDYSIYSNTAEGTPNIINDDGKTYACNAIQNSSSDIKIPHHSAYELTEGALSILVYDHHNVADGSRLFEKGWDATEKLVLRLKRVDNDKTKGSVKVNLNNHIIETGEVYFTTLDDGSDLDTQWVHVVVTFGSAGMKLYINGELKGQNAYTGGIDQVPGDMNVPAISGYFDELYVIDGQPTDAEVLDLYSKLTTDIMLDGNNRTCTCGWDYDFGDAPGYAEAKHRIKNGSRMGNIIQIDDGISFAGGNTLTLEQSKTINYTVANQINNDDYLHAWIDFDQNKIFDDDEAVITPIRFTKRINEAARTGSVDFTVPADAKCGQTWARFRYGSDNDVPATGEHHSGEVEDYPITIEGCQQVTGNLTINKVANRANLHVNDLVTYTITVNNGSNVDVTGVQVIEKLDGSLTYQSHSGDGSYNPATGLWAIGDIAEGADKVLQVVALVN